MRMEITNVNAVFGTVLAQGGRSAEVFAGSTQSLSGLHLQGRVPHPIVGPPSVRGAATY